MSIAQCFGDRQQAVLQFTFPVTKTLKSPGQSDLRQIVGVLASASE